MDTISKAYCKICDKITQSKGRINAYFDTYGNSTRRKFIGCMVCNGFKYNKKEEDEKLDNEITR